MKQTIFYFRVFIAVMTLPWWCSAYAEDGGPSISPSSQSVIGTVNAALKSTAIYTARNFSGSVTYVMNPALPLGLSFSSTTGVISGTPTALSSTVSYTVTATDSKKGTASAKINLSVGSGSGSGSSSAPNCMAATLDAVGEGRRAYLRLNCYGCHGMTGAGGMGPKIAGEGGDVSEVVNGGGDSMPSFKNYLCPNDAANLTAYVNVQGTAAEPVWLDWWNAIPSLKW